MRKPASILILLLWRSLWVGSNPVGGMCSALVVGPGVKISSFGTQERGLIVCIDGAECRQLVLGDNVALVLAQCRWRSRLFALFVIIRRAAAYILAGDMIIVSGWIMSEMNTSDAPSRLQEQHQPGAGYARDR